MKLGHIICFDKFIDQPPGYKMLVHAKTKLIADNLLLVYVNVTKSDSYFDPPNVQASIWLMTSECSPELYKPPSGIECLSSAEQVPKWLTLGPIMPESSVERFNSFMEFAPTYAESSFSGIKIKTILKQIGDSFEEFNEYDRTYSELVKPIPFHYAPMLDFMHQLFTAAATARRKE